MAIVNVSLDTNTKECVLTIDGVLVSASEIYFAKYTDYNDPEKYIKDFSYTVKVSDNNGLIETRRYYLPKEEHMMNEANLIIDAKTGLSSEKVINQDKIVEEISALFNNK